MKIYKLGGVNVSGIFVINNGCTQFTFNSFKYNAECVLTFGSKTKFEYTEDGNMVKLHRKGIYLSLPKNDFEKHFIVV